MSLSVSIAADAGPARERITALQRQVGNRAGVNKAAAAGLAEEVRENFRKLSMSRHRSAKQGSSFYAQARDATISSGDASDGTVAVTGPRGIRLRRFGGTITPGPGKKFLAIPVGQRFIGVRAAELPRGALSPVINRRTGKGVLLDDDGNVAYALTQRVTQRADPSVLPAERDQVTAAVDAAGEYVRALINRRNVR